MSEIEDSGQDGQQEKTDSSHSNYIDLASLDDTWNRLQIRQRERFTLWGTVDRWGPGAIAILTLLVVALILWLYSVKIAEIQTELRHAKQSYKELAQRLYVKELKDQQLREGLIKKGIID